MNIDRKSEKRFNFGFTLIELLVVIAVIAILAGLVIIRITNASANARNSRRSADLNNIKKAIEIFKSKGGVVNPSINNSIISGNNSAMFNGGGTVPWPNSSLSNGEYPFDPLDTSNGTDSVFRYRITSLATDPSNNYTLSAPKQELSEILDVKG